MRPTLQEPGTTPRSLYLTFPPSVISSTLRYPILTVSKMPLLSQKQAAPIARIYQDPWLCQIAKPLPCGPNIKHWPKSPLSLTRRSLQFCKPHAVCVPVRISLALQMLPQGNIRIVNSNGRIPHLPSHLAEWEEEVVRPGM